MTPKTKTADQVRAEMVAAGISLAAWARAHKVTPQLVSKVLNGHSKSLRGDSHRIAVLLGLKRGSISTRPADLVAPALKRSAR